MYIYIYIIYCRLTYKRLQKSILNDNVSISITRNGTYGYWWSSDARARHFSRIPRSFATKEKWSDQRPLDSTPTQVVHKIQEVC